MAAGVSWNIGLMANRMLGAMGDSELVLAHRER
jgi:hypothetical protein